MVSHRTAARLHGFDLPHRHTADEAVDLTLPRAAGRAQRRGVRLHWTSQPVEPVDVEGLIVTGPLRTLADLLTDDDRDTALCAAESAHRRGIVAPERLPASPVLALADWRSESALETLARLVLYDGGLVADEIQAWIFDRDGHQVARGEFVWWAARLVVEVDGRASHEQPGALLRDRHRQNELVNLGSRVLRFTWFDVTRRPAYVVRLVREALTAAA